MSALDRLYKKRTAVQEQIDTLEDAVRSEQNSKQVGRCFKYMNSYGSDSCWPYYAKVLRIEDGCLVAIAVQQTSMDEVQFETNKNFFSGLSSGWDEISVKDFDGAWNEAIGVVANLNTYPMPRTPARCTEAE